jgi:hypothetical protein
MNKPSIIPDLRFPSDDELRARSEEWMKSLRPCLYTHWPRRYRELPSRQSVVTLVSGETAELLAVFDKPDDPWSPALQAKIDDLLPTG